MNVHPDGESRHAPKACVPQHPISVSTALIGMLVVAFALRLHAVWQIGFYQDDSVSSSWKYEAQYSNIGIWKYCYYSFQSMLHTQGRVAPLYNFVVQPLVMGIGENLLVYRSVQLFVHLLALGAFVVWLKRAGASIIEIVLALTVLATIYQLRDYHDPAFSQAITMSLTAFFGFLSIACSEYQKNHRVRALVFSAALGLAATMTHEFGLPFAMAAGANFLLAAGIRPKNFLLAVAVSGPAVMLVGVSSVFKLHSAYEGTSFGRASASAVAVTFAKQLLAAVPATYQLATPPEFGPPAAIIAGSYVILACLGALVVGCIVWVATGCINSCRIPTRVLITSGLLMSLSAGLIAFSLKYQQQLTWGMGYAQTYTQYFCMAAIIVGLFVAVCRLGSFPSVGTSRRQVSLRVLAVAAAASAFFGVFCQSLATANFLNKLWRFPREILAVALEDFSQQTPEKYPTVIVDRDYLQRWENFYFLYQHTGWRAQFVSRGASSDSLEKKGPRITVNYPRIITADDVALISITPTAADAKTQGTSWVYVISNDPLKLDDRYINGCGETTLSLANFPTLHRGSWFYKRLLAAPLSAPGLR